MEIKISSKNILWLLSVALGVVGFVMLVVGIILVFAADNQAGILRAMAVVVGGIAFAAIPHSLASSFSNLANVKEPDDQ